MSDRLCVMCAGKGCRFCSDVQPEMNEQQGITDESDVISPVCMNVELDKLTEVLRILKRAKNPTVTFYEDIERMRKQAANISEVSLQNAIVLLTEMVNR